MASINFYYRSKSKNGNLSIRFKHANLIDYRFTTSIISWYDFWYNEKGEHRDLSKTRYRGENEKKHLNILENLKENLLTEFTNDYNSGVPITKDWLKKNITKIHKVLATKEEVQEVVNNENLQKLEQLKIEQNIHDANLVKTAIQRVIDIEYFDNKTQSRIYKQLLNKIKLYEEKKNRILLTKDVTQSFIDEFTAFLIKDLKHQLSTAKKHCKSLIHSIKYQKNAMPDIVEVSNGLREIKYKKLSKADNRITRSEIVVTLSFSELDEIHNTEVPEKLLNAKKIILFGCEVGLRVSDYDKLTDKNIKKGNNFEYWSFWNKKTGIDVVIPITQRIKKYIDCYGMPKTEYNKTADVIINREIKEVCKLAGINEKVQGRKSQTVTIDGKKVRRTISMEYPKSQIITTHSLRRSFATNYYNILTPFQIRQITGHTSDAQLMEYINQGKDKTNILEQMMLKMNEANTINKPNLKVIKNGTNN